MDGARLVHSRAHLRVYHRTDRHCASDFDFGNDRLAGEVNECNSGPSSKRTSERIGEQVVVETVPQIVEEIVELVHTSPTADRRASASRCVLTYR